MSVGKSTVGSSSSEPDLVRSSQRKLTRSVSVFQQELNLSSQIHLACRQAGELDMQQADAVSARMALDLRIGAAFTRLTTLTLQARVPELQSSMISYGKLAFPGRTSGQQADPSRPVSVPDPRIRRRSV